MIYSRILADPIQIPPKHFVLVYRTCFRLEKDSDSCLGYRLSVTAANRTLAGLLRLAAVTES